MKSDSINELALALSKAQKSIKGAIKDSSNPFFKSSYADLQSVWDAIREPLASNGLAITQTTESEGSQLFLLTTLMHASGQWIDSKFPIVALKNEPQAIGSATSYARRYSLAAIVGVYQTDDDGEQAQARQPSAAVSLKPKTVELTPKENVTLFGAPASAGTGSLGAPFDLIMQKGPYKGKQIQELTLEQAKTYFEEISEELKALDRSPATLRGPSRDVYYTLQSFIEKGGK